MKEEYLYHHTATFALESGESLPGFTLKYTTAGNLRSDRSNVIWVCHALTGSSDATDWWNGLFGPGGAYSTDEYFVICANTPGGCYGSTGPLDVNPATGNPWYHSFPTLTTRDAARVFDELRKALGFEKIHTLIGGSLGGQQLLEWAILRPQVFRYLIPVACNAWHSPWGIAFNESQRMAIELDPTWTEESPAAGSSGMEVARSIAMLSYRSHRVYSRNQAEPSPENFRDFRAASYQRYQGKKLAQRFNAFSYHLLSRMMDSHHVGRGKASAEEALNSIRARTLVVGIDEDILFPPAEQHHLARHIPGARYAEISSAYGHDSFLVEFTQLNSIILNFLADVGQTAEL